MDIGCFGNKQEKICLFCSKNTGLFTNVTKITQNKLIIQTKVVCCPYMDGLCGKKGNNTFQNQIEGVGSPAKGQ